MCAEHVRTQLGGYNTTDGGMGGNNNNNNNNNGGGGEKKKNDRGGFPGRGNWSEVFARRGGGAGATVAELPMIRAPNPKWPGSAYGPRRPET